MKRSRKLMMGGGVFIVAMGLLTALNTSAALGATPTATAKPATNLISGTIIKVTGTNWPKNDASIAIVECTAATATQAQCDTTDAVLTTSNGSGVLAPAKFPAIVGTVGSGLCATGGHLTCYLNVADVASSGAIHAKAIKLTYKNQPYVQPGTVTCKVTATTVKFSPALSPTGPHTGSATDTISGKLTGCHTTGGGLKPTSGKLTAIISSNKGWNCNDFATNLATLPQSYTVKWLPPTKIVATTLSIPGGDVTVNPGTHLSFTLSGGGITGTGSYPGSDSFAATSFTAVSNVPNLAAFCTPQFAKSFKITSGSLTSS